MDSDPDGEGLSAARRRIVESQNHLLDTGLSEPADALRDALQDFLGAESDIQRISKTVSSCFERDADGVQERERIGDAIAAFWNASESVRTAIKGLPFDLLQELKAHTSNLAWASQLREAIRILEQPWLRTRHWKKYPLDSIIELVRLDEGEIDNKTPKNSRDSSSAIQTDTEELFRAILRYCEARRTSWDQFSERTQVSFFPPIFKTADDLQDAIRGYKPAESLIDLSGGKDLFSRGVAIVGDIVNALWFEYPGGIGTVSTVSVPPYKPGKPVPTPAFRCFLAPLRMALELMGSELAKAPESNWWGEPLKAGELGPIYAEGYSDATGDDPIEVAKTADEASDEKLDNADAMETTPKRRYVTVDEADLIFRAAIEAGHVQSDELGNAKTLAKKLQVNVRTLQKTATYSLQLQRLVRDKADRKQKHKQ